MKAAFLLSCLASLALGQSRPLATSATGGVSLSTSQTITGAKTFTAGLTGTTLSLSGTLTSTVGSGTNGFACATNGCRIDVGAGANDFWYSDGSNIKTDGPVTTATLNATNIVPTTNYYAYMSDSTASPGAATIDLSAGKSAVASGAATVTITNNRVLDANAIVLITPLTDTTNCRGARVSTIATGSFVVTCPGGVAGANWSFAWLVVNKGN